MSPLIVRDVILPLILRPNINPYWRRHLTKHHTKGGTGGKAWREGGGALPL